MSSDNIDLQLNLDPSGFVQGAQQAAAASGSLANQFAGTERHAGMLGKALSVMTPGRIFSTVAISSAAAYQEQLSGMSATASVTHQSMARLQQGMAGLARSMPVGNRGAVEITSTLQSMGYAGKEQIGTINELGKAYARLGAATGTNASMIGRQMTTLNRAFGASDNNTARFTKMSDSLVNVTAKIGGSSSDILQFSKSIAPMARSAGIGQTAVMGISAAFSKMGEDGYGAANAMNKMLTDLNRSVRDGSGEMGTYANIVGKTRQEFEALFKNDPTKALGLLTKSLGNGPGAERNLERIGLDGVRTSRVFQSLSQQGGIEKAAATAVAGYGDGSTDKAAKASETLADEFTKLRSATGQVAEALGRPFLGALSKVVQVAGVPARGAASILNSSLVQKGLEYGVPLAIGGLGVRALGALGNNLSMGRHLINNQMTQAFSNGREASLTGVSTVPGQPYGARGRWAYGVGQGFQDTRNDYTEARQAAIRDRLINRGMPVMQADQIARTPAPSFASRVMGAPRAALNAAAVGRQAYNAVLADSSRQLRVSDATMRSGTVLKNAGLDGLATQLKMINATAAPAAEKAAMMSAALKEFGATTNAETKAVGAATKILRSELSTTAVGLRALAAQAGATGNALLGRGGAGAPVGAGTRLLGGLKGIGSALGGPQMAVMGGLMLGTSVYSSWKGENERTKAFMEEHKNASISGTLDAYRESVGKASDAVQTFAEQVMSANKAVASSVTSYAEAQKVTDADIAVAKGSRNKIENRYTGSTADITEQVRAINPRGLNPSDLQAVKVDLLRQLPASQVGKILAGVGGSNIDATAGKPQAIDFGKLLKPTSGQDGTSVKDDLGRLFTGRGDHVNITKAQRRAVNQANEAIGQTYSYNADQYGDAYATQERGKQANQAFAAAQKTGNKDLMAAIAKTMGFDLTGKNVSTDATGRDYGYNKLQRGQGTLTDYLAHQNAHPGQLTEFGRTVQSQGLDFSGKGGVTATTQDSALTKATDGIELFGRVMSNRAGDVDTSANKMMKAFLETPGDMDKFRAAMDSTTDAGAKAGMSLTDVGGAALKTVKALGDATSDASKIASAIFERTYSDNEANAGFQGKAVTSHNRFAEAQHLMESADSTPEGQQRFERGRALVQSQKEEVRQQMVARLQAQFEFQKQSARAQEDFTQQSTYAWEDYHKSVRRSDEDYNISRLRATRDFNIQVQQSEQDFQVSRMRATRDFNKNIARQNEDAAKSMYDPYKRMQVQATSDTGTLMANLAEQNQAMEVQKANLARLRKAGVSNQVIDQLGLNKSDNAQQVARMVGDVANGMSAQALNQVVAQRVKDAGVLSSDSSNKDRERARQDFDQSMKDNNADFQKGLKRNQQAFSRSLTDQSSDYHRQLARQQADFEQGLARQQKAFDLQVKREKQDLADSQKEILGSFEQLASAAQDAMVGKAVDFKTLMHDTMQATVDDALNIAQEYPQVFAGKNGNTSAGQHGGSGPQYTTSGGPAASGGASGGGHVAGNAATTTTDRHTGDKISTYTTPGTGQVVNNPRGTGGKGGDEIGMKSDGTQNFRPSTDFMKAHPANPDFNKSIAKAMMSQYGWGMDQWPYLEKLWTKESGWNQYSDNSGSSAYGIPQALAGTRMAAFGADWRTNPATQIKWGMDYIKNHGMGEIYRTPERAWAHEVAHNNYAVGGIATAPHIGVVAERGVPEAMVPLDHGGVAMLAAAMTQYITGPDAQRMLGTSHGTRVTYTGNTFIEDHSTQVTGPITVQATDPNDMMNKLAAKARMANLTATPSRKSS